nr:DUF362 domain-containing protein [candidate division Zixibacteria bacterium]
MISRRDILKILGSASAMIYLQSLMGCASKKAEKKFPVEERAKIWKAAGNNPEEITRRMIDSLGGIETLVDKDDIIVLKVNSQWWNQGMTNTDVLKAFIDNILASGNFTGEIIIADNHQAKNINSRGWTTAERNGRFNYNELVEYFNGRGFSNVTKYHWNPASANPTPLQLDGFGDAVRSHPSEGDGYIWPKDLYYECPYGHRSMLAYPVFTSAYSGTTVDLKNGAFREGEYTGQPVKFFNFSALNHHSRYAGVTASIKNYMGVVDMSCGYPAPYPEGTFNTHHIGASDLFRLLARHQKSLHNTPFYWDILLHPSVFRFRYTGGVLGAFMKKIRPADMHFITAVTVGWGSRTDVSMAARANTLLASKDPVALDYWAAYNILLKAALDAEAPEYFTRLIDPSIKSGPLFNFLEECRRELGGTTNPDLMELTEC